MRSLVKTLVPNRALVSTRFALSDLSEIPLVAVPFVTELVDNLMKFGYGRSIAETQVVDVNGEPLPWYTNPLIEYLEIPSTSPIRQCLNTDAETPRFGGPNEPKW